LSDRAFKTLDDIGDVQGKRVLVRVDLNAPMEGAKITEDSRLRAAVPTLCELSDAGAIVLVLTHLGRPRAGPSVGQANAVIERVAAERGALVVDLRDFGARNRVMADAVHPTAFGQIAIAERALDVLAADGMQVRVRPSALIAYETTWRGRLRGDAGYVYRQVKQAARIGLRTVVLGERQRRR